jgi:hypothetical protein
MGHSTEKPTISDRAIKNKVHTTIALLKTTKEKIDKIRASGQCYDGFLCQMIDLWERMHKEDKVSVNRDYHTPEIKGQVA